MSTTTTTQNPFEQAAASQYTPKTVSLDTSGYTYPEYLPTWDHDEKYPPLEDIPNVQDPGLKADKTLKNVLGGASKVTELTPKIGTEIDGVQISKLTKQGLDDLALLTAQRKVLVFRNQDLAGIGPENLKVIGRHFGRLHIHATSGHPKNHPEFHLVHRSADDNTYDKFYENRTSSVAWHSDVTYERHPPSTTFLAILEQPTRSGGDTLFVSQVEAYNRLSEAFKQRLVGLEATHSGHEQANFSRQRGGVVRREPVIATHPLVRVHPVTGEKALFVNEQFTREIVGFKKEESDYLLNFLYQHIAKGADFQARVRWEPGTVVVWDNRVTAHTALLDYDGKDKRHAIRITPQAERPIAAK